MCTRSVDVVGASGKNLPSQDLSATMKPEAETLTARIGLRLRTARKAQKLSLQALADMTDGALAKFRLSNYEQGLRRLGIEEAQILAKVLGTVSVTHLLCLDEEFLNKQERELLRCFQETDDRGSDAILALAESQCGARDR